MSAFTITLEIPALDRLTAALQAINHTGAATVIPGMAAAPMAEPAAIPAPAAIPTPAPAPAPIATTAPTVTLAQIMRAAAELRDAGKLDTVTALFPEFDIHRLSDLQTAEQLNGFAARLREIGARIV